LTWIKAGTLVPVDDISDLADRRQAPIRGGFDMQCIVTATDGSDAADRAVDFAADLAAKLGADLVLTHVVSGATLSAGPTRLGHPQPDMKAMSRVENVSVSEVLTDTASDILDKARDRAMARGVKHVESEIRAGDPAETIIAVALEHRAEAIVLGKRGRGRLAGLLLGSVSQQVATLAHCPVILVP
jgi:nucleotide-binding universal stress UspA family protein